jgi:predicted DNA binding protein
LLFYSILISRNNENKAITNSRDTQEVLLEQGHEFLKIFHSYKLKTSLLDDFEQYNKAEEAKLQNVVILSKNGTRITPIELINTDFILNS